MKKIMFGVFLWIFGLSAWAAYQNVPEDAILGNLPEDSVVLVLRDIKMTYERVDYRSSYLEPFTTDVNSRRGETLTADSYIPISEVRLHEGSVYIGLKTQSGMDYTINFDRSKKLPPTTVREFHDRVGNYFRIFKIDPLAYDPYPGVAKDIVVDLVMTKIVKAIQSGKYSESIKEFAYLERLGIPLPESFYYYYTQSLSKAGKKEDARTRALDYLKRFGKNGKYYTQVIEILSGL